MYRRKPLTALPRTTESGCSMALTSTPVSPTAPRSIRCSPPLRDGSYLTGLNQYLRNVESHAGLSFGVISQVADVEKTATEIVNSKQKLYATVSDLQAALEDALRGLINALDYWADHIPGAPGKGKLNIAFKWDDSIISTGSPRWPSGSRRSAWASAARQSIGCTSLVKMRRPLHRQCRPFSGRPGLRIS